MNEDTHANCELDVWREAEARETRHRLATDFNDAVLSPYIGLGVRVGLPRVGLPRVAVGLPAVGVVGLDDGPRERLGEWARDVELLAAAVVVRLVAVVAVRFVEPSRVGELGPPAALTSPPGPRLVGLLAWLRRSGGGLAGLLLEGAVAWAAATAPPPPAAAAARGLPRPPPSPALDSTAPAQRSTKFRPSAGGIPLSNSVADSSDGSFAPRFASPPETP